MEVTQVHGIVNTTVQEVLGESAIVNEDLTNIVDIGNEIIDTDNVDNYVKKLVNHIGKVIFTDRAYSGNIPSVLMDSWEFGSILEKISADMPIATENSSWELEDGKDYSPDVFYQPKVSAKFFNSKVTFEVPLSFTEKQIKESFSNAEQLNGFISMLYNSVEKSMTVRLDNLVMRTINNMIGETIYDDLQNEEGKLLKADLKKSGVKTINLLKLYNEKTGATLTPEKCMADVEFIKFSSYIIKLYKDRISKISTLFNVGGKERFTPSEYLHIVLLTDFASASDVFVNSQTYHNDLVELPDYETVPYWQGSGLNYEFEEVSKIDVKTSSGQVVNVSGIVGIMFDTNTLGVTNLDKRVTSNYNPKAEFYTNFYKMDAGYFNDLNENFIVFFVG